MKKNKFNIKDFNLLPAKQKQAVYILGGSILAFIIVVIASSVLIFGTSKPAPASSSSSTSGSVSGGKVTGTDSDYKQKDGLLDLDKLKGTVLEKAADAGSDYITDTLFIGDSNMERLVYLEQIGLNNFAGKSGMGISTFATEACVYFENDSKAYTIAKAVAKMKPRRVIMTFGTNDAGGETSPSAFAATYKKAITSIQKAYPYCDIIINTIPPVAKKRSYNNISMQTIDAFNVALANLAKEMELKLLNSNEVLRGEDGFGKASYFAAEDGIHFTEDGAKAFINYVRTHASDSADKRPDTKNIPNRRKAPAAVSSSQASSSSQVKYASISYRVKVADGNALGTLKGDGFSGETQRSITFSKDLTAITVTAVPAEGYEFAKWSDGVETATRTDSKVTESFSVTANFTKKAAPVTIKLDSGDISVEEGKEFSVTAIVSGQVEAKNVVWKTDGVHVNTGEKYTATLSLGTHKIEASIEGATAPAAITVTVTKKVLPVTISITAALSETTVGTPAAFTANVANAESSAVVWTVNDVAVASGATYTNPAQTAGTFTIKAAVGGVSASVTLTVKEKPVVPPPASSTPVTPPPSTPSSAPSTPTP